MKSKLVAAIENYATENRMPLSRALKTLGLPGNQYYNWRSGHKPQHATVCKVADALGVPVEDLVEPGVIFSEQGDSILDTGANESPDAGSSGDFVVVTLSRRAYNVMRPMLKEMGAIVFRPEGHSSLGLATGRYQTDEAA